MSNTQTAVVENFDFSKFCKDNKSVTDLSILIKNAGEYGFSANDNLSIISRLLVYREKSDIYDTLDSKSAGIFKSFFSALGSFEPEFTREMSGKGAGNYDFNAKFCVEVRSQLKAKEMHDALLDFDLTVSIFMDENPKAKSTECPTPNNLVISAIEKSIFIDNGIYYENLPRTLQAAISIALRGIGRLVIRETMEKVV